MKRLLRSFLPWFLIGIPGMLYSQTRYFEANDAIEDLVENIARSFESEELDFNTFIEILYNYLENPIDLNKATADELLELPQLSELQVRSLLEHRDRLGELLNLYELQTIPDFDLNTIRVLVPFVTVKGELDFVNMSLRDKLFSGKNQVFMRYSTVLEDQRGYLIPDSADQNRYLGSKAKLYLRYDYSLGTRVSYGFTAEKDQGEEFFRGSQKRGFDFYSGHFYLRGDNWLKELAVGDYEVNAGQGLVLWSGFGFRKSIATLSLRKSGRILKPYTSVNENLFLRGAAATVRAGKMDLTVFGSYKKIDANKVFIDSLEEEFDEVTSFQQSGFHRTESEILDRHAVGERILGGNLEFRTKKYSVGVTAVNTHFSSPLNRDSDPYSQFNFQGDHQTNFGIHYNALWRNFNFFGETAVTDEGNIATVNGLLTSLDRIFDIAVVYRNYARDYNNFYGNAFAESTRSINEKGVYLGLELRPSKRWLVSAYFDTYRHEWLRFRTDAPSQGFDFSGQVLFRPSRRLEMYVRVRDETKPRNSSDPDTKIDYLECTRRSSVRYNLKVKPMAAVTLKSRVEFSFFKAGDVLTKGYLLYQDIIFQKLTFPMALYTRIALFDTDTYDDRIYTFESDVLYNFSIPAFSDRGMRYYLMLRFRISRWMDAWVRYSQTYYSNRESIGTGLDEIEGNTKSEFRAMVRLKW